MILRCPACGAQASFECWTDQDIHAVLDLLARFPKPTPQSAVAYLALFRPEKNTLTWKKARKVLTELLELVTQTTVKVPGKYPVAITPALWAKAMDQMIEQADRIKRPLSNHNYLKAVAHNMADDADLQATQPALKEIPEPGPILGPVPDCELKTKMLPKVNPKARELWNEVLEILEARLLPENFNTWLSPTHAIGMNKDELWVFVPNDFYKKCLAENYMQHIVKAVKEVDGTPRTIRFTTNSGGNNGIRS